jgi:hypothetical protein
MKTLINNLTKLAILAVLTFAGVTFADAASFDTNPSNTTGTVSIIEGSCSDCGGQFNSVAIPNLAPGESVDVNVFTDYMVRRNSSQWIYNATVRYLTQDATGGSSSFNFQTRLRGDGASDHVDFARVTCQTSGQLKLLTVTFKIPMVRKTLKPVLDLPTTTSKTLEAAFSHQVDVILETSLPLTEDGVHKEQL